jgi:mono/diheme cytochrome c family protein
MRTVLIAVLTIAAAAVGAGGWLAAGGFDVAADSPHSPLVFRAIEFARDRGVEARAEKIAVPALDDPKLLAKGAKDYVAMCEGCHLGPGVADNEFRKGVYPQPPDLFKNPTDSDAEAFWIVKHGLKMTAMPAWGLTHDDATLWGIVAFLKQLPTLTPAQYQQVTASAAEAHHEEESHADHEAAH